MCTSSEVERILSRRKRKARGLERERRGKDEVGTGGEKGDREDFRLHRGWQEAMDHS